MIRNITKSEVLAGVLFTTFVCAASSAGNKSLPQSRIDTKPDSRARMEQLIRARTVAWFAGDADTYSKYTAERFLWNGAAVPGEKPAGFPDARPFAIDNLQLVEYPELVVASYTLTEYLNYEEGAPFDRRRRTEVWISEHGQWKVTAVKSSEMCASNSGRMLCY